MKLKENIRRVLREETKLPAFIRRRYSKEDINELINNVKEAMVQYDDDKHPEDVIHDEVREFMMDKSEFSNPSILDRLNGEDYWVNLSKNEEPLVNYIKSILNIY